MRLIYELSNITHVKGKRERIRCIKREREREKERDTKYIKRRRESM